MASLSKFLPYILPSVVGCPNILAEQKVLTACIDFCDETQYWRYEHPPLPLIKNVSEYNVKVPDGAHLVSIVGPVDFNGHIVHGTTKEWLDNNETAWKKKTGSRVNYYYKKSIKVLRPVPIPDETILSAISFDISLKPMPDATQVEDFLFDDYFQVIADGALSKLFEMKDVGWSDPKLSSYHRSLFSRAVAKAKAKASSGFKDYDKYRRVRARFF